MYTCSQQICQNFSLTRPLDISVQRHRSQCKPFLVAPEVHPLNYSQEDVQEDWGWKLVHGEVFRTPRNPMILSVMVGNGSQLCAMVAITLGQATVHQLGPALKFYLPVFALLGFLSPSNRGSLATVMMVCWTLFGGYVNALLSHIFLRHCPGSEGIFLAVFTLL